MGFDVFNGLDLAHNGEVLKDLKFGIGDGNLQVLAYMENFERCSGYVALIPLFPQYYLYNYAHPEIAPSEVGLVLL